MLASVSSIQPAIQGSHNTPQHSLGTEKEPLEENKETGKTDTDESQQQAFKEFSREDQVKIQRLKSRDLEVKAHEQAHLSAAGVLAIGGASFIYTKGPNGVRYATGGEVSIDTSKVEDDPFATIRKADAIRRAALAPANPSSQDQLVASNATSMAEIARTDLIQLAQEEKQILKEAKDSGEEQEGEEDTPENNKNFDTHANSVSSSGSLVDISV